MGQFLRDRLPDPLDYYAVTAGLVLKGPKSSKWKTTACTFHGGSDSMRIHTERGAFMCMSCGAKGGDLLAYHMAANGLSFVEAAKALDAYQEDAQPHQGDTKPAPIAARVLLGVIAHETTLVAMLAADMARGKSISATDAERLHQAVGRIQFVNEAAQHANRS